MSFSPELSQRLAEFPTVLRRLVEAELAAGNEIAEIASSFPAPPAGAYVKLKRPITTRKREKADGLDYYNRNSSLYSGEWTDAKRFFFVLEPAEPPPPEPDMEAIRAAANRPRVNVAPPRVPPVLPASNTEVPASNDRVKMSSGSLVERFEQSMAIDYEKWHDGIGYDVALIAQATPEERTGIERLLLARGGADWRDVEALALLDTPAARKALNAAMRSGNAEIRAAVMRHAPALVSDEQKKISLLEGLLKADFYGGLSQTLDAVSKYHPPEIVAALLRGVLERKAEGAIHFAAMLMFIHGKAKSAFDWDHRPFFLKFGTPDRAEREVLFRELCAKIGVNPDPFLTNKNR
jgi:hypothetical protein